MDYSILLVSKMAGLTWYLLPKCVHISEFLNHTSIWQKVGFSLVHRLWRSFSRVRPHS
jgi:hypothetical protein